MTKIKDQNKSFIKMIDILMKHIQSLEKCIEYNEFKQMQKQMTFIKKQLKESLQNYEQLSEQVKELLKNVKCDIKIKPQISQICQILGYSPNTTSRILSNKKTGIFGILSGKK